jgi:Fungal Zn(2)-Cys(6) binuclear cluster domain
MICRLECPRPAARKPVITPKQHGEISSKLSTSIYVRRSWAHRPYLQVIKQTDLDASSHFSIMAPNSTASKSELLDISRSTSCVTRRKHHRIPRACDRCRIKKAKCDGRCQCNQCATHDSPCTYTHRKHHSATK